MVALITINTYKGSANLIDLKLLYVVDHYKIPEFIRYKIFNYVCVHLSICAFIHPFIHTLIDKSKK